MDTVFIFAGLALIAICVTAEVRRRHQALMRDRTHRRYIACTFDLMANRLHAIRTQETDT